MIVAEPLPHRTKLPVFWGYDDILIFIGLCFPALLIAMLAARGAGVYLPWGMPFLALFAQAIWYILIFGALALLFHIRYGQPFWRSLGWKFPFRGAAACLLAGPLLAIGLGLLGYVIRTPQIKPPFNQMLSNRPTTILFAIFAVVLGPLCEELAFRGFLMPLLIRSFGAAAGILATAVVFGAMHGYEYAWSWRHILLIAVAGAVFGWVRYATASTASSTFMHATFNLTQLAAFLSQPK